MSKNADPTSSKAGEIYQKLGANERAIVDKIETPFLRNLFIHFIGIKLRLQFTGWLQFLMPVTPTLVVFLVAGILYILGATSVAGIIAWLGVALAFIIVFDIITVKFRIRPPERLPKRRDNLDIFELMRARHSCRSYQTRKLTQADREEFMESVKRHSAESRLGQSPVRFEYISAPLTVWPTVNGSEFLVAIAPKEYDRLAVMDVGRSLQKIVIDATRMGLGTCWIGPGADHKSVMHHLGDRIDPQKDNIICVCAVGYESWFIPLFIRIFNRQMHRRLALSSLFFADAQMKQPLDVDSPAFKQFGRNYEVCQWSPSSYNGQTTRCVGVVDDEDKPKRFDFYAATASRYYAAVATGIWCANWEMGCQALGIDGHFEVLSDADRGVDNAQKLPQYDVSWIVD